MFQFFFKCCSNIFWNGLSAAPYLGSFTVHLLSDIAGEHYRIFSPHFTALTFPLKLNFNSNLIFTKFQWSEIPGIKKITFDPVFLRRLLFSFSTFVGFNKSTTTKTQSVNIEMSYLNISKVRYVARFGKMCNNIYCEQHNSGTTPHVYLKLCVSPLVAVSDSECKHK